MDHPIKQYRRKLGMTQEEFARQFGVATATICRWETGVRFPDRLNMRKLSVLTGIPVDVLIEPMQQ
jgi:DNA-binding transcriptional regulator YiaG